MDAFLLYLAVGALAGVMAGLFGVGGGLILVPALTVTLGRHLPIDATVHLAVGTSLGVIALTSLSSTLSHHRRGGVLWQVLRSFAPGLALGAWLGAFVADALSGEALRRCVGVGALLIALQMLLDRKAAAVSQSRVRAHGAEVFAAGSAIGLLSSLVGIGGGSLSVPYLTLRGATMRQAVGTAAAGGVPIAWAGACGFLMAGLDAGDLPPGSLGYLYLPALAALSLSSVFGAPLGARLAHRLPPRQLKRLFAAMLLCVSAYMLLGGAAT